MLLAPLRCAPPAAACLQAEADRGRGRQRQAEAEAGREAGRQTEAEYLLLKVQVPPFEGSGTSF
jgi:hypothetical protein